LHNPGTTGAGDSRRSLCCICKLLLQPPAGRITGTALYGVDSALPLLGLNSRGRRSIEFGQFARKNRGVRELGDQLRKLRVCYIALLLAQARQRQQDLRKRPEIAAVGSGDLDLLYAAVLIAADSCEAEEEPLWRRQAPDDVVGRAQGEVGIGGIRGDRQ